SVLSNLTFDSKKSIKTVFEFQKYQLDDSIAKHRLANELWSPHSSFWNAAMQSDLYLMTACSIKRHSLTRLAFMRKANHQSIILMHYHHLRAPLANLVTTDD